MIDLMRIDDVAEVFKINKQVLESNWGLLLYRHELLDLNTRAYVYKKNDKVVGYIIAKYIGETSDLLQIAVHKDYQKKRIGYELLKYTWDNLVGEGVEEMILEVNAKHTSVVSFYESFGFETLYRRKNYYGPRKDALVMKMKVVVS
ncbi:MAG: ribosomal protein S18-alanine N-acetyltransferase [Erysipelothrix sp.]|nr:ribosomal protein S18-alanine N-acetyltransferase [Erysipelothrix sp.]